MFLLTKIGSTLQFCRARHQSTTFLR